MYPNGPPPPQYTMLENQYGYSPNPYGHPAAYQRNGPRYPAPYPRSSGVSSCCRCICCCCCCILLIFIINISIFYAVYSVYDPRLPSFRIEGFGVKAFNISQDSNVITDFQVSIRAENPNRKISFNYGDESYVKVLYMGINIGTGNIPNFHQPTENSTLIKIDIKGKAEFGQETQKDFAERSAIQRIPILVLVKVPVNVVLGDSPLREFKIYVICHMILDNLAADKPVGIISKETKWKFEL
ncbi:UNVERIFIED_CONTAM: hypothetical protein Sangu_2448700 [Sesamum angustifolium]|uniref:Late embryogenesis abundant protein LEA-2 subgroup domain-containing protein n=1 Tax=Sesamum angustifolium TaxID=2727405 RepID=A0AAW2KX47_9LAMI